MCVFQWEPLTPEVCIFKWEPLTPENLLIIVTIFVALFGERIWKKIDKENKIPDPITPKTIVSIPNGMKEYMVFFMFKFDCRSSIWNSM